MGLLFQRVTVFSMNRRYLQCAGAVDDAKEYAHAHPDALMRDVHEPPLKHTTRNLHQEKYSYIYISYTLYKSAHSISWHLLLMLYNYHLIRYSLLWYPPLIKFEIKMY